jgi:uncharacterized protein YjiS (DUF1127 family)
MEVKMVNTETQGANLASSRPATKFKSTFLSAAVSHFKKLRRAVRARKAITNMSAEQLRDIGLEQAPMPSIEVPAGLIPNLMSMR